MPEDPNVPPADLSHAGAVVDKAIEYMMGQNIGSLAIASALLGGSMALLSRVGVGRRDHRHPEQRHRQRPVGRAAGLGDSPRTTASRGYGSQNRHGPACPGHL